LIKDCDNLTSEDQGGSAIRAGLVKGMSLIGVPDLPLLLAIVVIPSLPTQAIGLPLRLIALEAFAIICLLMIPFEKGGFLFNLKSRATCLDKPITLFFLFAAAGLLIAPNREVFIYTFGNVLALATLFYCLTTRIRSFHKAIVFFLAASLTATAVSLVELVPSFHQSSGTGSDNGPTMSSLLYIHSYLAAMFLIPTWAMIFAFAVNKGTVKSRILAAIACTPILVYIFRIGSRGAYFVTLATAVFILILSALRFSKNAGFAKLSQRIGVVLLILAVVSSLIFVLSNEGVFGDTGRRAIDRLENFVNPNLAEFNFARIQLWKDAVMMSKDNLLLGVGAGNFAMVFSNYHLSVKSPLHAHNQFVHLLSENGIICLVCFLIIIWRILRLTMANVGSSEKDNLKFSLQTGAAAALFAAGIYCLFETPLQWPATTLFLFIPISILLIDGKKDIRVDKEKIISRPAWIIVAAVCLISWIFPLYSMTKAVKSARLGDVGYNQFKEGKYEIAENTFKASAEAWPCRPEILQLQAFCLVRTGRYKEALETAKKSLELRPGYTDVLSICGECLIRLGRHREAIEYLKAAIVRSPKPLEDMAYLSLAKTYRMAGLNQEALIILQDLVKRDMYPAAKLDIYIFMISTLLNLNQNQPLTFSLLTKSWRMAHNMKNFKVLRRMPGLLKKMENRHDLSDKDLHRLNVLKYSIEFSLKTLEAPNE